MRRFLVHSVPTAGARLALPPAEARHAHRVLRLGAGDEILVTDGRGSEARAKIVESSPDGTWVEVLSLRPRSPARACKVELLQAPLKGPRMDWLVEKLTELGVDVLRPVHAERTVSGKDKEERWARLVQAAVKQSGNVRAMELAPALSLADALAAEGAGGLKLLLSPGAPESLAGALRAGLVHKPARIVLAIGPEGGFSAAEETLFIHQGFQPVALSPQVLRGETAGLAAAAITLHLVDF